MKIAMMNLKVLLSSVSRKKNKGLANEQIIGLVVLAVGLILLVPGIRVFVTNLISGMNTYIADVVKNLFNAPS